MQMVFLAYFWELIKFTFGFLKAEFEEDKTIYYGNFIQPTADTEWLAQHIEWDAKQLDHFTMILMGENFSPNQITYVDISGIMR